MSLSCSGHHRDLHSFPTRRSSDLVKQGFEQLPHRLQSVIKDQRPDALPQQTLATQLGPNRLKQGTTELLSLDRKSTRLNSSHVAISYAVFCLKKKNRKETM